MVFQGDLREISRSDELGMVVMHLRDKDRADSV